MFNVAAIKRCTETEGPYKRFAIWFQGCNILCEGCCNPELQPFEKRHLMSVDELYKAIMVAKNEFGIEGVTLLGGEPTLQNDLAILCERLQYSDVGVILFTGRNVEELDNNLKSAVDMVVDGQFLKNEIDDRRNMIGSSNQRIILMTGRYFDCLNWFEDKREKRVEFDVDGDLFFSNGDVVY